MPIYTSRYSDWIKRFIPADDALLLDLIVRICVVAFLIDDIIEYRLFIHDLHIYLPSPVFPFIPTFPVWSEWLLLGAHIAGLIFLIWRPRFWPAAILVFVITVLRITNDLMTLQPNIMMYGFTILVTALPRISTNVRLQALRLMIIGVYFWAGFHKLNSSFFAKVFPWFIQPFWTYPADQVVTNRFIFLFSLTVPVFEMLIGIFLIFKNTRIAATCMAFIMLIVVLACLGPFGHNWGVLAWPWNIYIFISELFLFLSPHPGCFQALRRNWLTCLAAAVFMIAPALSIWQIWDAGPSFKLYTGNVNEAYVILDKQESVERLPVEVVQAMQMLADRKGKNSTNDSANHGIMIPVYGWISPVNIAAGYSSDYVAKTSAQGLCPYLAYPATAIIRYTHHSEFRSLQTTHREEFLCRSIQKNQ